MAYQQGSYDYYSQSQYAATPDPSYSSQSFPSQVSYSTTSSGQDISSYQTQGYAAVTDTSASGDNQGSHSYQSYPYASSYDYGNVTAPEQANYAYSQSTEAYGSSYDSNYSQTNTSGENLGQSASVAVAGGQDQYYYSQSQVQGDNYYTEYQTSSTTSTVTNQPALTQSQYASYGSAPVSAVSHDTVNRASDQAYQYDYSNTNASNNTNVSTTSQTQDWTGNSSQGQAAGLEQSSTYYNATPQIPYGSTQAQATSDYKQTDQSYYNTTYDQNVPSGQGYVQRTPVSSGPEAPKQNQIPMHQQYGEQPRFDARPDIPRNNHGSAVASYQTSSQPDWNTRTSQNTVTGSQFAGHSSQQSSRTFPPKDDRAHQNSASQPNKPTFSSVIEHLAKLQEMSKTRSHPNDGKRQSSAGDQTQQKGPGTTLSNLRPIMPSSAPPPRMHSRQQPLQRNLKPSDNRQSFSPTRGNQNVANRKGSGGLDRNIGQGKMHGSQGQFSQRNDKTQKFPPNQHQGRQEQNRQQYKGPHKMENKGPGSLSNSRPMSTGRPGHISKGGHNNQGQSMGGGKMSPHGPRIPGMGPRGPHFNQQGGDNWMRPRGGDEKFPRGPGHMASPRGSDGMLVRGPGPRAGGPMPPRGPFPPPPKGSTDMQAPKPGSSPQKRKRSMEDDKKNDKKSDKRSQRMPDSPPPEVGRQQGPPFRPRGPHDRFFRFGLRPPGEMFGPRFRGPPPDMFFDGPRGMRLRHPFGPRRPGPWEAAPPEFMHRMRGRFPFPFWEGKHDRDDHGPPMLEPLRKRRRSSGSPHGGGDDLGPPMSANRGGPSRDAPRGPHPRHLPPDVLRGLPPMHRPDKNSVPQFTGTKAGKFGKFLTEKKKKAESSEAKKLVKKGTEAKFQCDVCQVGFATKESLMEHTKQHKQCDVEGCGFEGVAKVLQLHKQQAHQPNIPAVKWSRDKEDVQSWLEERKRNFPTASTIAAKKAVQEDKERMGAVLTTKEFGKMKRKKQDGGKPTVDDADDTKKGEDEGKQEDTTKEEPVGEEGDKTKAEEDSKVNEAESKEETEETTDGKKTSYKEDDKERPKEEETGGKEEAEKSQEGKEAGDEGEGRCKEKTEMAADVEMEEDEEMESASEDKEDNARVDEEEDHTTTILSDGKETTPAKKREVTFQVVKKEVKRVRSGKASKREPWRTNRPVQKFISTAGGNRRATLLEMLLAPEMRHERNLLLQCVRYTVKNNFFEPKKEVGTTSGAADSVERKSSAESPKEQIEKSGTSVSSHSSLRDEDAGNANEGMTSDEQDCKNMTVKDEAEESVSQGDAQIHLEKSETAAVMDSQVKDEQDECRVSHNDGDDYGSTESSGNLVSASEVREQTFSVVEEKGESVQKVENAIRGGQSRLDADSERTSNIADREVDSREDGENGDAEKGERADNSGDEKMETDGGEQQGALTTEEAAVSGDDDVAVSIAEAGGNEEKQNEEEDAVNVGHSQMEDVEMSEDAKEAEDKDMGDDDVNDDDVSDDDVKDETQVVEVMVQQDEEEDERQASEADELQEEEPESEGGDEDTKALEDADDDDVVDKTEGVEAMAEQDDDDGEDRQAAEADELQKEVNTGIVELQKEEESRDDANTGEGEPQEELEVERRDEGLNQNIETEAQETEKIASAGEVTAVGEIAEVDGEKPEEHTKVETTKESTALAGRNDETGEKGIPKEDAVATEVESKDEGEAKTSQEVEEEESQQRTTSKKVRLRRSSRRKR